MASDATDKSLLRWGEGGGVYTGGLNAFKPGQQGQEKCLLTVQMSLYVETKLPVLFAELHKKIHCRKPKL